MSTKYSLHLRSTAAGAGTGSPWNEASPSAYVIGDTYPTTRNGLTFGYTNGADPFKFDLTTATNARISGRHLLTVTDPLRVNLPDGPGNYNLWLALGNLSATVTTAVVVMDSDGTTPLVTIAPTSVTAGNAMDASGAQMSLASWLSSNTPAAVTISGDHFFIQRNGTTQLYLDTVEFQLQAITLADATFTNDLGDALTTIYALQPQGQRIAKITATGAQSFSLAGTLASYFSVSLESDGHYWIVGGSSRLPDAASGTLQVVQTDANGTNSPHSTDVIGGTSSVTITSSQSRPTTGNLGDISTQTWLRRKANKDVTDLAWAGWTNQSFATDVLVTSPSALVTAISNAVSAKTGTSWHRIRCGTGGDWTGNISLPAGDFGTGGLLITKDSASDPVIDGTITNGNHLMLGWHFYDLTFGLGTISYIARQLQVEASASGFHKIKISNCRIGRYYSSGYSLSDFAAWGQFVFADGCDDFILEGNTVRAVEHVAVVGNIKRLVVKDNDVGLVYGDMLDVSQLLRPGAAVVGTDMWIAKSGNARRDQPDVFTTLDKDSALHADDIQLNLPIDTWSTSASVTAGQIYVNLNVSKVYTVATSGTTASSGTGPSGTGTGIADGTATWNYLKDYVPPSLHILVENELIVAGGTTSFVNSLNNELSMPGGSGVQDNLTNLSTSAPVEIVYINNMAASPDLRGIQLIKGDVYAEFNTFVGPFEIPAYDASHALNSIEKSLQVTTSGSLRAKSNIVGVSSGAPFISVGASVKLASQDNIGVGFVGTTPAGMTPSDLLVGTFTQRSGDNRWVYTADDTIATDTKTLQSTLSKMMRPKIGRVGARLKELHTLTITDAATGSSTVTLEIDP